MPAHTTVRGRHTHTGLYADVSSSVDKQDPAVRSTPNLGPAASPTAFGGGMPQPRTTPPALGSELDTTTAGPGTPAGMPAVRVGGDAGANGLALKVGALEVKVGELQAQHATEVDALQKNAAEQVRHFDVPR